LSIEIVSSGMKFSRRVLGSLGGGKLLGRTMLRSAEVASARVCSQKRHVMAYLVS
jgi:hypothetical protein